MFSKFVYPEINTDGKNHFFVIIDNETIKVVDAEYFGMLVSSQREKAKDNSIFEFNEPLDRSSTNGLDKDSITKCDVVYSIPLKNILFKIGSVDVEDYVRFIDSYSRALKQLEENAN